MWSLRVVLVQLLQLHSVICIITPIPVTTQYFCSCSSSFVECIKEELQNLHLHPSRFPVDMERAHYLGQAPWDADFSERLWSMLIICKFATALICSALT